jgi:hypothetical protein
MVDVPRKTNGTRSVQHIARSKRHRRSSNFKNNLLWCGIILIITLILGAIIGFYSNIFDQYFTFEEEKLTISEQNSSKKLQDLYMDRLLREKERSRR